MIRSATVRTPGRPYGWSSVDVDLSLSLGSSIILVLALAAYLPALRAGFVWDDPEHFVSNPLMTHPGGLLRLWTEHGFYYPLTSTSFWIMRRLWDLNPLPYHLANVLIHAVNSILLWRLARRLGFPGAHWAGVIFALHPVHVQSVAWATELKNVQSGLFYLLSLHCYVRFWESRLNLPYALALVCFMLAVLSKTSTVILPIILLLLHIGLEGRPARYCFKRLAPFFLFSVISGALTVLLHRGQLAVSASDWDESFFQRTLLAMRCIWFYLLKLAWPSALTFVYPRWDLGEGIGSWILPPIGLAGGVVLFVRCGGQKACAVTALGCLCFMTGLLPVLNIFRMYYTRYAYVADHWQYLANMSAIPWGVLLFHAIASRSESSARIFVWMLALVVVQFGLMTFAQSGSYKDGRTLWFHTISKNPSCWIAHSNLGSEFLAEGRTEQASYHFAQALKSRADVPEIHIGLAAIEIQMGRPQMAENLLLKALQLDPENPEALVNLAGILISQGKIAESEALVRRALARRPEDPKARTILGGILQRLSRFEDALVELREAVRLDSLDADAHRRLGEVLSELGEYGDAEFHLLRATHLAPKDIAPLVALGIHYGRSGAQESAVRVFQRARDLQPDNGWIRFNLGVALIHAGRETEGLDEIEKARELEPRLRDTPIPSRSH